MCQLEEAAAPPDGAPPPRGTEDPFSSDVHLLLISIIIRSTSCSLSCFCCCCWLFTLTWCFTSVITEIPLISGVAVVIRIGISVVFSSGNRWSDGRASDCSVPDVYTSAVWTCSSSSVCVCVFAYSSGIWELEMILKNEQTQKRKSGLISSESESCFPSQTTMRRLYVLPTGQRRSKVE